MKKKIAIIGGSYLQLPVVEKAQQMGLEVYCFSWKDGAVCAEAADHFFPISIIEKESILKECQAAGIDGITTIASDTAVLTVNYVAGKMNLISNSDEYSQTTTNKFLMRQCFEAHNVPSPKYVKIAAKSGTGQVSGLRFPVIVKPTDRSGSRGVEKVCTPEDIPAAVARAQKESFTHEAIVEEYVSGKEISVEAISYGGKHHILQITDKVTTGEPFFVELAHHQPSCLPQSIQDNVKAVVLKALNALHIEYGASHSELKITESGDIRVIEIGARMGGDFIGSDLVRLSTGYDFLKGAIEVALGTFSEPVISRHDYSGAYFLCKETEWLKKYIINKKDYPQIVRAEVTDPELRDIECSGDRSGYLIYQSHEGRLELK